MAKKKQSSGIEIPQGLSLMMARSPETLEAFNALDEQTRAGIIAQARSVQSKAEMENLVSQIGK